jgi:hypothetical protein
LIYNLPYSVDPEGLPFKTTIESGPSFVKLISNTSLKINPNNCGTDFGNKTVYIKIEDEFPSSSVYSIDIEVSNLPPLFLSNLPIED